MDWQTTADQIKADEGFERFVYADTEGVPTIGYGRNLRSVGVSRIEAEIMFGADLRRAYSGCLDRIPVFRYLDDDRQGVLVNMAFNLGIHSLLTFKTFLSRLDQRDFPRAADAMLDSLWAEQVKGRATRLADRMRGRQVDNGRLA